LALEFDLVSQFVLNRYDLEIEKMRLSVWGVPEDTKPTNHGKPPVTPKSPHARKQTMTAKDIMRNYK
jgi:hypothetical protein